MKIYHCHVCGMGNMKVQADTFEWSDSGLIVFRLKSGKMVTVSPVDRTVIYEIEETSDEVES